MAVRLYVVPVAGDGTTGTLVKVTWPDGVDLQVCDELHVRSRQQARSPAGGAHHVSYGAYTALTLRVGGLTRAAHQDFIDRLAAADSQLTAGAICHFARQSGKAGLWPLTNALGLSWTVPSQGATTLYHDTDLLSLETSPTLAVGDDLVVETEPPEGHQSYHRADSVAAGTPSSIGLVASNGIFFDSSAAKAVVRHAEFWPYLTLSEASLTQQRLRRVGAMAWSWEATFESQPIDYFDLITGVGP